MAKITAEKLEIIRAWQEFGNRLGWMFVGTLADGANFFIEHKDEEGTVRKITIAMRRDIERTWREAPVVTLEASG